MGFLVWVLIAMLIIGFLIYTASRQTRRLLPQIELPPDEKMPKTLLQRYAGRTVFVTGALTALAASIVAWHGPQVWWDNDHVRLTVTFVLLAALAVYLIFTISVRTLEARDDGSFDERDSVIMSRACAGVGGAMMVVVVVWMVALTEAFRATHLLPTYYLYLIFWSVVMTNVITSVAGILLAYRRN